MTNIVFIYKLFQNYVTFFLLNEKWLAKINFASHCVVGNYKIKVTC